MYGRYDATFQNTFSRLLPTYALVITNGREQNFGRCLAPKTPGWINCWGRLNPRFQSPGGGNSAQDEHRSGWASSDISYVADETLFPTIAGASAASHASADRVRQHWKALRESTGALAEGRVGAPLVPHMPRRQLEDLKESILKARCPLSLAAPPFVSCFISITGGTVPVAYTRTAGVIGPDTSSTQLPLIQRS